MNPQPQQANLHATRRQSLSSESLGYIAGFGSAIPSIQVSNQEFEEILDTSDEWISKRTGIRNRYFCASDESSATLGVEASQKALADAGLTAEAIDLIVCATVSPQSTTPPNATRIQHALGCRAIPAFDISAACSGFMFALSTAASFLQSGKYQNILVVAAEALSRRLDYSDRNSCILFGDAAGAVVLSSSAPSSTRIEDLCSQRIGPSLLSCEIASKPDPKQLIRVPSNSVDSKNSLATRPNFDDAPAISYIGIDGREVFRFAIETMSQCIEDVARRHGIHPLELDLIVPHQVNTRVFDAVVERLEIDRQKIFQNISQFGNTAAASIPVALEAAAQQEAASIGDLVCLVSFGGGLTWGSALLKW